MSVRELFESRYGDSSDEVELFDEPESNEHEFVRGFAELADQGFGGGVWPMQVSSDHEEELDPEERAARDPIGAASSKAAGSAGKKKGGRAARSEYFTFTLWLGMTDQEALHRLALFKQDLARLKEEKKIGFHACGHEVAPTTGRHHVQGYLETASHDVRWTYRTFKEELFRLQPTQAGEEVACFVTSSKGSAEANKNYTQKDCDRGRWFVVDNTIPYRNYGRGNQLGRVKEVLDSGASLLATAQTAGCFDAVIRYRSSLMWYENSIAKPRMKPTLFTWIHGPSGVGKSTWARERFPPSADCYWLPPSKNGNVWWDKYNKHKIVVIDEIKPHTFGLGHAGFAYALRIFDGTPLQVGVHGAMTEFVAERVIITANFPMEEWFPEQFCGYKWDDSNPLRRRLRDFGTEVLFGTEDPNYERSTNGPAGADGSSANFVAAPGDLEFLSLHVVPSVAPLASRPGGGKRSKVSGRRR